MYQTSKNYERLYDALLQGHDAVGFVDFRFHSDGHLMRDVCAIKRRGEYNISIGVRGTGYAAVYPFMKEDGTEKDLFVGACESINLEWVEPTTPSPKTITPSDAS